MTINNYDNIIVMGAGGTGSILLPLLARFAHSQGYRGHFTIVDGDSYSESNIQRQLFGLSFINMNKAEYQANSIASHIPEFADNISVIGKYLGKDEIFDLVQENCVVFNCTDNKAARKFVEDACLSRKNSVHICSGNEMRTGQVQIALRVDGVQVTPSIFENHPEFNSDNDDRSSLSCEQLAALPSGGQLISANATAAVLSLNMFITLINSSICEQGKTFPYSEVWFNTFMNCFEIRELVNA